MKFILALCLVAVTKANFIDDIGKTLGGVVDTVGHGVVDAANTVGHGVVDTANTVGHGVVDAANTVGHGVVDAANVVGGALGQLGPTLGSTFGDVWNVVKDPLAQAGKEVLVHAAEFALQQGVTMALDALAAGGKRDIPDLDAVKGLVTTQLVDEYQKWLQETENQIKNSKQELTAAMMTGGFNNLPLEMKDYLRKYVAASVKGDTTTFVTDQANVALKYAVGQLKQRLTNRLQDVFTLIRQA